MEVRYITSALQHVLRTPSPSTWSCIGCCNSLSVLCALRALPSVLPVSTTAIRSLVGQVPSSTSNTPVFPGSSSAHARQHEVSSFLLGDRQHGCHGQCCAKTRQASGRPIDVCLYAYWFCEHNDCDDHDHDDNQTHSQYRRGGSERRCTRSASPRSVFPRPPSGCSSSRSCPRPCRHTHQSLT